ncbi:hypothetical protein AQUCO_01000006v1 [Aquilegia coerulea]|uniref:Uncharacterized protein n=1 Tax=Aquilegia coerulea TaxID=218851 RepID=A0A2G5E7W0_AQUCA|nr:hypothetical protein AQUCO_01000006v1 [Aquilegia coerulea]
MKNTMKAREGKKAHPANFHVCFPSNPNLTLTPKPFCSPARPTDTAMRHHHHGHHQYHHPLTRCNNRAGQASPSLWPKTRPNSLEITEPSSPKVTCAGQIKIRPKKKSSKKWQSVMEEIEIVHNNKNDNKSSIKIESRFGLKKDKRHFLNSLRCFGTVKESESDVITSIDDEEVQEPQVRSIEDTVSGSSKAVVSKWFMVLQDDTNKIRVANEEEERVGRDGSSDEYGCESVVPPSDALLLMRSRSAPTKNFLVDKEEEEQEDKTGSLILKCYGPADFLEVKSDLPNENWLVSGMKDPLSRSRRWRRC